MKYFSTKSGYIIDENNLYIPMDESSSLYLSYKEYVLGGNPVEFTKNITDLEVASQIDIFREDCSFCISTIKGLQEAIERKIISGTDIPLDILHLRECAKMDYNSKKEEYLNSLSSIIIITTT
jgi:hypothetical protein